MTQTRCIGKVRRRRQGAIVEGQCYRPATEGDWCHQHSPVRDVERFQRQVWKFGEQLKEIMPRLGPIKPGSFGHIVLVQSFKECNTQIDLIYAACKEIWPDFPDRQEKQ